jgi:hypothetical protein
MVLLGCKPQGRLTEQHDIFFGIATELKELVPNMYRFWPEANEVMHIDCWREVTSVDGYSVKVIPKAEKKVSEEQPHLFFINLGGYKPREFEEYHYKLLAVGRDTSEAIAQSKQTAFFKHTGFKGGESHVDDKYGIDTDDLFKVEDALSSELKKDYMLDLQPTNEPEDPLHIGYVQIKKLLAS